jgi:hypothetical protein
MASSLVAAIISVFGARTTMVTEILENRADGHVDLVVGVEIAQQVAALLLQHADDAEGDAVDLDFLAQGVLLLKKVGGDFAAQHGHVAGAVAFQRGEEAAAGEIKVGGAHVTVGRPCRQRPFDVVVSEEDLVHRQDGRGHGDRQFRQFLELLELVHADVLAVAHQEEVFITEPGVLVDVEVVCAERADAADEGLVDAVDGGGHQGHRADADDDAEHGQERTGLVGADGRQRDQ